MACVKRYFLLHLNFLSVLPRVCRTPFTQIPIAAVSRAFFRSLRVLLTLLMHLQNLEASVFFAILITANKKLIAIVK
jgi:hypothetical protein